MKFFNSLTLILGLLVLTLTQLQAQDSTRTFSISGSADAYYKYDFSGNANIGTSFADEQNSISIGMLDLIFEGSQGKASFVGELAFGPRNAGSAGPAPDGSEYAPRIQNLYMSYQLTDKLSVTGGYMGTFVGYEIISPTGNFNYSTSYLFTNGPFQNAGVKLDYAFTDGFGLMVGVFNPWNVYTADPSVGPSSIGAQLYVAPVDGWDAYLNFVTGGESGTEVDLTTTFQVSDDLMLGVNAASYSTITEMDVDGQTVTDTSSFAGGALYINYSLSDDFALGVRGEQFFANASSGILSSDEDASVTAVTLSANIGSGALKLIPEVRFESASTNIFLDANGAGTSSAFQALIAAVYAF
jgi:hypothetical protein